MSVICPSGMMKMRKVTKMNEAIEKLLEAKNKGLDTYPFSIMKNQVLLSVKDTQDEDFSETLCEFKLDFNDQSKVYTARDLSEHFWEKALQNICQRLIDKEKAEDERKFELVRSLLLRLEDETLTRQWES
jgi:hypothetical protein